jgi:tRNA(Ile2)-agmatinylcytidine synthase
VIVTGLVQGKTRIIEGGHVICTIGDKSGTVDCAAYEPSGKFRQVILHLQEGDEIRVAGGVRETKMGLTVNLERLEILSLVPLIRLVNPKCPRCGSAVESMGKGQRLRCKKCNYKGPELTKTTKEVQRELALATYLPPPRAERHLTKPIVRYGKEKSYSPKLLFLPWHS